jgi:RNA polymerase sigma-70 factor (ECF subfamily)
VFTPHFAFFSCHNLSLDVVSRVVQPEEMALDPATAGPAGNPGLAVLVEALFREHYTRIVGMLARLTGDRGHSEEIASDVFHKLSQRPALLSSGDDLAAWIYRVATNAGLDALRTNSRRRRREEAAAADGLHLAAQPDALDRMLAAERAARVRDVLASLKPRDAQLLLLRSSGLAYRELAVTLGIEPGSVGTLLARAEAEFQRRFRARYGDSV